MDRCIGKVELEHITAIGCSPFVYNLSVAAVVVEAVGT